MEKISKEQFINILKDINDMFFSSCVKSITLDLKKPIFGEVWIAKVPILIEDNGVVCFESISRPLLIIDDGHEYFVKNDNKNYYALKITSQKDNYQRMKIPNYQKLGLQKESFIRIEVPQKVEREQFLYPIGKMSKDETLKYLAKVQSFLKK